MRVSFRARGEVSADTDLLVVPVFEGGKEPAFRTVDSRIGGILSAVLKKKPDLAKMGVELVHVAGQRFGAVLVVGLGTVSRVTPEVLRRAGGRAWRCIRGYRLVKVSIVTRDVEAHGFSVLPLLEGFLLSRYAFTAYLTNSEELGVSKVELLRDKSAGDQLALAWIKSVSDGVHFARDLVNAPANEITPAALATVARGMSGKRITVKVFDRDQIMKMGMHAFLAVAKGSREVPRLIVMQYSGKRGSRPLALVGKAITFDSGGLSIKPSEAMEKMKYDMAGGAAVLGVFRVANERSLPVNLVGVIPACENLPGGSALRPGDIVRSMAGKTVEIVNTDAEGRLLLADGIEYSKKFSPRGIIDIATLTGACSVALGNEAIAMMGNDESLIGNMSRASDVSGERVWQMPLYDDLSEYIKSDAADMKNTGGRVGSLISAAYFLKQFAGDIPWLHLDIASTAWSDKDTPYAPAGASGAGVRVLAEFMREGVR